VADLTLQARANAADAEGRHALADELRAKGLAEREEAGRRDRERRDEPAPRGPYKRRPTMKDKTAAKEEARKEKRREHEDERTKLRNEVAASNVKIVGLEEKRDGASVAIKDEKKSIARTEKKIDALSKKIKALG
jgi:hypothetical protein